MNQGQQYHAFPPRCRRHGNGLLDTRRDVRAPLAWRERDQDGRRIHSERPPLCNTAWPHHNTAVYFPRAIHVELKSIRVWKLPLSSCPVPVDSASGFHLRTGEICIRRCIVAIPRLVYRPCRSSASSPSLDRQALEICESDTPSDRCVQSVSALLLPYPAQDSFFWKSPRTFALANGLLLALRCCQC